MNRRSISLWMIVSLAVSIMLPISASAVPLTDEEQQILEKSLSIVEIDREIGQIEARQKDTENSILLLTGQLAEKNEQIQVSRKQAGERIRAYYMGERENLLSALLSVNSLKDFFTVLDYYQLVMDRDRDVLNNYKAQYAELTQTKKQLVELSGDLSRMKQNLLQQRERVADLQRNVDSSLGLSSDPDKLRAMITELTEYWKNVGLDEVRRYFKALSSAMTEFPDFLQEHKNTLTSGKDGYTLTINEQDLNDFLHSKNELLTNLSFRFDENKVTAEGSGEGMELKVEGHYTVENEPVNCINFRVDHLLFNGLELPDTTRADLENHFDLGFYPQKIIPFVKATKVTITKGTIIVKLKLSL